MIYTLKKGQTRHLIDTYGLHVAKIAEQSRDMALIAWALLSDPENAEKRRDLLIDISRQVSDVTNLMIRLKNKQDA